MDVALVSNASTAPADDPPPRPRTFLLPLPPRAIQSRPRPGTVHPPDSFRWLGLPEELKIRVVRNVDHRIPTFDEPEPPSSTLLALSSTSRWFHHVCKPLVWMVVKFDPDETHKRHRNLRAFEAILQHHEERGSPIQVKILAVTGLARKSTGPAVPPMTADEYAAQGGALVRIVENLARKSLEALSITDVNLEWAQGNAILRASRTASKLSALRLKDVHVRPDPQYTHPARQDPTPAPNAGPLVANGIASTSASAAPTVLPRRPVTRSMRQPLVLWTLSEEYQERRPPLIKTLQLFNSHDMFSDLVRRRGVLRSLAFSPDSTFSPHVRAGVNQLPQLHTLSFGGKISAWALHKLLDAIQTCSQAGTVLPLEELIIKGPCVPNDLVLLANALVHLPALRALSIDNFCTNTAVTVGAIAEAAPQLEHLTLVAGNRSSSQEWPSTLPEYLTVLRKFRKLQVFLWDYKTVPVDPVSLGEQRQLEYETMARVGRACPHLRATMAIIGSQDQRTLGYGAFFDRHPERLITSVGLQKLDDINLWYDGWMIKRWGEAKTEVVAVEEADV